jgi:hypothetical protein
MRSAAPLNISPSGFQAKQSCRIATEDLVFLRFG